MFTPDAFAFFAELAQNNDRTWFAANKARFESAVKAPFADLLARVSLRLEGTAVPFTGGPDTMFRIHRDTRFGRDKSPYKTNIGGLLTPTGRKDMSTGMVYIHLDAAAGFVACGLYQPDPPRLAALRDRMVRDPAAVLAMVAALGRNGLRLSDAGNLTRLPKGFESEADSPIAAHLRRRSLFVEEPLPMSCFLDGTVADRVADHALRAAPLLAFTKS
jgi:uncharacterized protein (TIGR02453 family)